MTRKCLVLFCDNEHGPGDVTFPDLDTLDAHDLRQWIIETNPSAAQLRRQAKKLGWGRINLADYCPACMEAL